MKYLVAVVIWHYTSKLEAALFEVTHGREFLVLAWQINEYQNILAL